MLSASPRITRQIIESIENGSGHARRNSDGDSARARIRVSRVVITPLALPIAAEDYSGARSPLLYAIRQHRQRHLQCVRLFVRQRLGGQIHVADRARLYSPIHITLAFGGNVDFLGLPAYYVHPANIQSKGHVLGSFKVVMSDNSKRNLVALAEETRGCQPHNQVFAHQNTRHHAAGLAVVGHRTNRRSPSGQRIREAELDARMAIGAGMHVGIPVSRIREGLAHFGYHQVRSRLYLRQPRMEEPIIQPCQQRTLQSSLAVEVISEGGLRIEINVPLGIERCDDVSALVGAHRVKRLIHLAKAQVSLDRLARRIHRQHVEAARFPRQIARLAGRGRDGQCPLHQRDFQTFLRGDQLVLVNNYRVHHQVRL